MTIKAWLIQNAMYNGLENDEAIRCVNSLMEDAPPTIVPHLKSRNVESLPGMIQGVLGILLQAHTAKWLDENCNLEQVQAIRERQLSNRAADPDRARNLVEEQITEAGERAAYRAADEVIPDLSMVIKRLESLNCPFAVITRPPYSNKGVMAAQGDMIEMAMLFVELVSETARSAGDPEMMDGWLEMFNHLLDAKMAAIRSGQVPEPIGYVKNRNGGQ